MGFRKFWRRSMAPSVTAASIFMTTSAFGQTPAQFQRVDQLAQYTVESVACADLGFTLKGDEKAVQQAAEAELVAAGAPVQATKGLYEEAVARRLQTFGKDLKASEDAAFRSKSPGSALQQVFVERGEFCSRAAGDPLFSQFLQAPAPFDAKRAALELADQLLESGGLASWQTPQIQARGNVVLVAGACRRQIGSARSDAIFAEYTRTADPRTRSFYSTSFQQGLTDPDYADLDAAQCERAIRSLKAEADR